MSSNVANYKIQIDAEISNLETKVNAAKKSMQGLLDSGGAPEAQKMFDRIGNAIDNLKKKSEMPAKDNAVFSSLLRDAAEVSLQVDKLGNVITKVQQSTNQKKIDFLPKELQGNIANATKAIETFEQAKEKAEKKSEQLTNAEKQLKTATEQLTAAQQKQQTAQQASNIQKKNVEAAQQELDLTKKKIEAIKDYQKAQQNLKADPTPANKTNEAEAKQRVMDTGYDVSSGQKMAESLAQLEVQQRRQSMAVTDAINIERQYDKELSKASTTLATAEQAHNTLDESVKQLRTDFENTKNTQINRAFTDLRNSAEGAGVSLQNIPTEYSEQSFEQLKNATNQLAVNGIETLNSSCNTIQNNLTQVGNAADQTKVSINNNAEAFKRENAAASEVQGLISRIKYFVGLQGAVMLARRAFQSAFQTVKDLDAAMTEMAVVTDETISDYWNRLPEFTDNANRLGVSIKGAYEATTLYLQQGLKMAEAQEIANQTLKMGRIANLEAEDATNKMTAALRGFNMELNETSAQRVADVYSELAAITASDVSEISSAMTKTASIASSAGMQFETTAAFLSQIIETTRESAETAGTALKTVIARFQELKKDPSEIGEIDGEVVDANKIETALRSVGVALRDTSGQFRDLDDVFIELAGKWDSLDTNTQRYIATIAAGSRQQSRFIAMMSDYSRTQELVEAANTSAGASNTQFEKTLDSLESKLAKLKNSWDTFTMGIMNNTFIKAGIEILNGFLTAINWVVAGFDKIGLGSVASLGVVIGALILGTKALNAFELNLRKVDANGKRTYTTLGAIGATLKGTKNEVRSLSAALKNSNAQFAFATAEMKKYAGSSVRVAMAKQQVKKAQIELNLLEKSGTATTEQLTSARLRLSAAERDLARQQAIQSKIKAEANSIQALGFTATEAEILALKGLTAEEIKNSMAVEISNGATKTEARQRILSSAGIQSETNSLTLNDMVRSNGLLNFLLELGLLILGKKSWKQLTKEENKNTGAKGKQTIATFLQAVANGTLLATMWPILVATVAIIAAVLILVFVIKQIIKWINKLKASTPEGKLKSAEEAAEAAGKAADAAAESFSNLADSFDSLADKYTALEELTKGSQEWRDAVREINNEVLDLVDQYPELANLVTNEDGVLSIDLDSKEAQDVLKKYENMATQASTAELAAKVAVAKAKDAVAKDDLSNDAKVDREGLGWKYARAYTETILGSAMLIPSLGMTSFVLEDGVNTFQEIADREAQSEAYTDKMAEILANGWLMEGENGEWLVKNAEEIEALELTVEQAKEFAQSLGDGADELREYGLQLERTKQEEEMLYKAMAANIVSMVDTTNMGADQQDWINSAATTGFIQHFEENATKELAEQTKDLDTKAKRKEWATAEAKKLYGTDEIEVDNDGNVTVGTGDDAVTYTKAQFEQQWKAAKSTEQAANALEKLPSLIEKLANSLGKDLGKAVKNAYKDAEGGALTKAESDILKGYLEEGAQKSFEKLSATEQEFFGGVGEYENYLQTAVDISQEAFLKAGETLKRVANDAELSAKLTSSAAKGYAEALESASAAAGQESAKILNDALNALGDKMSTEDFNSFVAQLNALDWKNLEDWENLPGVLDELEIAIPNEELEEFIKLAQETAGAIRKVDLAKLNEDFLTLASLKDKIRKKEQTRTFSESDYNKLVEKNADLAKDFVLNLNGEYVYIGEMLENLIKAIEQNTSALLGDTADVLQDKVLAGEILQQITKKWTWANGAEFDITNWDKWATDSSDITDIRTYLSEVLQELTRQGVDLSNLGILELGPGTLGQIDTLEDDVIEKIAEGLKGIQVGLSSNKKTLKNDLIQSLSLGLQTQSIALNANETDAYRKALMNGALNPGAWTQYESYITTISTQALLAGANEIDYSNYIRANEQLAIYQKKQEKGIELSDLEKQALSDLIKQIDYYEWKLTNITGRENLTNTLTNTITLFGEFSEQYGKLVDESSKLELVARTLDDFGIVIDEQNYQDYAKLLADIAAGGEESYNSFLKLIQEAARAAGVELKKTAEGFKVAYDSSIAGAEEKAKQFAILMESLGGGMWASLLEGGSEFVVAISAIFMQALNAAGTATEATATAYDWIYNSDEALTAQQRKREELERRYDLGEKRGASTLDQKQNLVEQMKAAAAEANLWQERAGTAKGNIQNIVDNADPELMKYINWDAATGSITTDWKKVNEELTASQIEKFDELVGQLEEQREILRDSEDNAKDLYDEVVDIQENLWDMSAISDLMNQVRDGLLQIRQDAIDKLQENTDAINEAESALYDQIQKQIDDARQARANEKTEQELTDKQIRLAYLKRDSNANAMEIAQLEKEILEGQEDYQDSLVDQALAEMQDANEKAAEQRQEQIDILQEQLDAYGKSQDIWNDVDSVLRGEAYDIKDIVDHASGIEDKNPIEKKEYEGTLSSQIDEYQTWANRSKYSLDTDSISGIVGGISTSVSSIVTAIEGITFTPTIEVNIDGEKLGGDGKPLEGSGGNDGDGKPLEGSGGNDGDGKPLEGSGGNDGDGKPLEGSGGNDGSLGGSITTTFGKTDGEEEGAVIGGGVGTGKPVLTPVEGVDNMYSTYDDVGEKVIGVQTGYQAQSPWTSYAIVRDAGFGSLVKNNFEFAAWSGAKGRTYQEYLDEQFYSLTGIIPSEAKSFVNFKTDFRTLDTNDLTDGSSTDMAAIRYGDTSKLLTARGWDSEEKEEQDRVNYLAKLHNIQDDEIFGQFDNFGLISWYIYKNGGAYRIADHKNFLKKAAGITTPAMLGYATGGLADFTGPAWLDGTKSHPELVLNQQDTANFIQLKDILSEILTGTSSINKDKNSTNSGDNYYDIDISVESIDDDYDVEQMAEKIKDMIYEDATYRNVNTINSIG